jgi:serine/threonine-protein kinase RsbW
MRWPPFRRVRSIVATAALLVVFLSMSDPWIWLCDRVIPSDTGAGRQVLAEVLSHLEAEHWGQHDIFGIHLAMEEALVNAIQHGNGHSAEKHVYVSCRMTPDRVRIEIADEGQGFDPKGLPDPTCVERLHKPGGRGVMLMRAFMNHVEFNDKGNRVIMEKQRAR